MYNYNFNVVDWLLNDFKPNDNWYSSDMVISCISVLNIFGANLFIPSKFNMNIEEFIEKEFPQDEELKIFIFKHKSKAQILT